LFNLHKIGKNGIEIGDKLGKLSTKSGKIGTFGHFHKKSSIGE